MMADETANVRESSDSQTRSEDSPFMGLALPLPALPIPPPLPLNLATRGPILKSS